MNFFKKLQKFFTYPPIWFLIPLLFVAVISMTIATIILTQDNFGNYTLVGYILLGVMGLSFAYVIYGVVKTFPTIKAKALDWSNRHPKLGRFFIDRDFRSTVMTAWTFIINIAFAVYNGSIAIVLRSIWFGALAAYNIVLIIFRGFILLYKNKRRLAIKRGQTETETFITDTKHYGISGIMLILLPIALSFAILQMVRENDAFVHTGITIYVYAIYAFYRIISSIIDLIKARKKNDMIFRALKNLSLAGALMSILALQTAMFREFGAGMGDFSIATMNAVTGAAVCLLTAAMGIFMIINTMRIIKQSIKETDCPPK